VDHYRSKEWRKFREEMIRLGGGICAQCLRAASDGVILQVHHKKYVPGRKPWQYLYDACEVMCRGCHAKEHGIIRPSDSWELVGHDDFGAPDGECEYCGTEIRYVFLIMHPKWPALEVGEVCCDNLTATPIASNYMNLRRRFIERRKRFVSSSRWTVDYGHIARVQQCGINIEVVPIDRFFRLRMNGKLGKLAFASELDAKMKAFEVIDSGAAVR
jgi:hypothetical protein